MRATKPEAVRPDAADPDFFPYPEDGGNRRLRTALAVAVLFHALLLALPTPQTDAEVTQPEKRQLVVVQQVRFKPPPPPTPEKPIPQQRATLIPVPDPDPNDLEPLRDVNELAVPVDLPIVDVIFEDVEPPEPDPGPIPVGGKVARPMPLHTPKPEYTEAARKARIQGIVIVQLILDKQGRVTHAEALRDLPMGLTESTLETVRSWRYEPATLNGKPVEVYMSVTVNFTLQ
jgi:TonB family protein